MKFTLSVKSFHVPAHTSHIRLSAQFSFGTYFTRHTSYFRCE